ncbi:hypothetical protein Lepto7375DRAFT_7202 [Leptolyngbya sp. PCC 7375]|nr:hypothetical protein Lepto7375DRAFT_7202 [Leptolyngbya sp. PCC 7375]
MKQLPTVINEILQPLSEELHERTVTALLPLFSSRLGSKVSITLPSSGGSWVEYPVINTLQLVSPTNGSDLFTNLLYGHDPVYNMTPAGLKALLQQVPPKHGILNVRDNLSLNYVGTVMVPYCEWLSQPINEIEISDSNSFEYSDQTICTSVFLQDLKSIPNRELLLPRFLIHKQSDSITDIYVDKPKCQTFRLLISQVLEKLDTLVEPGEYSLDKPAEKEFMEAYITLQKSSYQHSEQYPLYAAFERKCPRYLAKLTLLFHCLGAIKYPELKSNEISLATILMAKEVLSYYQKQAVDSYEFV